MIFLSTITSVIETTTTTVTTTTTISDALSKLDGMYQTAWSAIAVSVSVLVGIAAIVAIIPPIVNHFTVKRFIDQSKEELLTIKSEYEKVKNEVTELRNQL